jgi:putative copper resistance protein D
MADDTDLLLSLCRFVDTAALMALFGAGAFRLYALGGGVSEAPAPDRSVERWLDRMTRAGAILLLFASVAMLLFQAAAMSGAWAGTLDGATLSAVLFETRFGHVWCCHLLIAAGLFILAWRGNSRRRGIVIPVLAGLLLATRGWIGHAAMSGGVAHPINQGLHLVAGGLWLGGLLPLAVLLVGARRSPDPARLALLARAVPRFSRVGYAAVALLVLTGSINLALVMGPTSSVSGSPYGRLLVLKLLGFTAMVVVAIVNRTHFAPRLAEPDGTLPVGAFCRSVAVELALGVAIVILASLLAGLPPAL